MRLIDTHCHLNDKSAFPNVAKTLAEAREAGVDRVIIIGIDDDTSRSAVALAEQHEGVYASVGWHPNYAQNYTDLAMIRGLAANPKVVALGEMGRDHHWDYATPDEQTRALMDQLDLAEKLQKPVIFHCREAYPELLDDLERRCPTVPMIFHCWAGNAEDAARAVALGAWFGVDGPITFRKADDLRAVVATLPHDRLVLETDAPYLSPHPYRGQPNAPAWIPLINSGLANTLGMSEDECAALTTANAERFFGI